MSSIAARHEARMGLGSARENSCARISTAALAFEPLIRTEMLMSDVEIPRMAIFRERRAEKRRPATPVEVFIPMLTADTLATEMLGSIS